MLGHRGERGDVAAALLGKPDQRVRPAVPRLVRGQGVHLYDDEGTRYLDLLAGIATASLGHAHPAYVAALADQAATLSHVSNLLSSPTQIALAERLTGLLGHDARVFLANSGTEVNEAAFKVTRRTGRTRSSPPRTVSTVAPWAP